MKNLKSTLIVLLCLFSFSVFSQVPAVQKLKMGKFKKEMNLSNSQATDMKAALKTTKKELKMLKKDKSMGNKEIKMQIRSIRKDRSDRLKDILNEEQYARYEEITMGSN